MRRWKEGDTAEVSGLKFRVVKGYKGPDDLRLEVFINNDYGDWVPVPMNLGFVLADFFGENEDHLYPPEQGYAGGNYYVNHLYLARKHGWEYAQNRLAAEKQAKRAKE